MTAFDFLTLFPALTEVGGVQSSGREALEVLGQLERECGWRNHAFQAKPMRRVGVVSKLETVVTALIEALRMSGSFSGALVWHVSLLKLLPFFRLHDARVAVFLHGVEAWHRKDLLVTRLLRRTDTFLVNSRFTWERFVAAHPRYRTLEPVIVPLGWGSPVARTRAPRRRPAAMLMLSRLLRQEDYKGHRQVIACWPRVLRRLPDAELWIVGDGNLRPELERLAVVLGVASSVHFKGSVDEAEKETMIADSRALAMPSTGEGFGLVYLEAMRQGRPCLTSDRDAGREVVRPPEAGLAVRQDDIQAMTESIVALLTPGQRWERWSAGARRLYERHFTARLFHQRLASALLGLDGRTRPVPGNRQGNPATESHGTSNHFAGEVP